MNPLGDLRRRDDESLILRFYASTALNRRFIGARPKVVVASVEASRQCRR